MKQQVAWIVGAARRHRRAAVALAFAAVAGGAAWIRLGPLPAGLLDLRDGSSTIVTDRRGVPLYEALSGDGTRSIALDAGHLPPALAAATIAAEDRRFRSHVGVDPWAIARALKHNLAERRIVEGGSTITQQTIKLLLNRRDPARVRGVRAKIVEAILAIRLEHRLRKDEILALYLNLAAYGNQVVGAGRASRAYFGRDASMLTTAQAAYLAGLPQRPSGFNPYRRPESALTRQRSVIARMEASGAIPPDQAREAREERIVLRRESAPFSAPHFVEMVIAAAGPNRPARIETTIDADLQSDVAGIISSQRASLARHGAANVAVVVLDNDTGTWLAWEGSGNYFDAAHGGTINGPTTPRQPGSALKPFTYALAFEEGATPATVLADIPSHFPTAEPGVLYSPRNYDGRYRGPLVARKALAGSENVPAVALASQLGIPKLLRFLNRAGLSTFERNASYYGLGVTLGNAEVRLDELVAAYSAFARGGDWIEPTWRPGAPDRRRRTLVSRRTAYWVTDILSDADAREFIFGRGGSLDFPFPVAVKTGTSQAYHDNWTVGYSRHVTVGVWVGNFDRTPLRDSTGITGAGPIFHAVMLAAERRAGAGGVPFQDQPIVSRPEGLAEQDVCSLSGMPANDWCPVRHREWLPPGDQAPCSWHHLADDGLITVWPGEYRQWASANGLADDRRPRRQAAVRASMPIPAAPAAPLSIASPPPGAVYLIDPTLRREYQTLPLRATAAVPSIIEWHVDGTAIGTSPSESALHWPLVPGAHRVTARDRSGHTAEARIIVK